MTWRDGRENRQRVSMRCLGECTWRVEREKMEGGIFFKGFWNLMEYFFFFLGRSLMSEET